MRSAVVLLAAALAASIAVGLLGLWPDLRGESVATRRERARIAAAVDSYCECSVTRVRLGYLPRRALVETQNGNGRRYCALVAENFGDVIDSRDLTGAPCDF